MMKLTDIKPNPNNPRLIKDDKFVKLCNSIRDFPKMMALRPIVIDQDNMVLGGNMRLKALQHLGFKEVPDEWVKCSEDLTADEQRKFIILDNVSGGEWDWEMITTDWDVKELEDWGLDSPNWSAGVDENNMTDEDVNLDIEFDPIGSSTDLHKVVFIFDNELEAESFMSLNHKDIQYKKFGGGSGKIWQVNLSTTYGKK
jgi:hypothetical protein